MMSNTRSAAIVAACVIALPVAARANAGFALNDGLTDWTANAYAGEAAKAYDAGTAWTNPAGMVRLHGTELDSSINFIDPSLNFVGNDTIGNKPVSGPQSRHGIDPAISAGSAIVISLTPELKVGFSAQSPFASRLSFSPSNYVGRYEDTNSIPTNVQGLFSAAYAINDHLSIGGGPYVSYFKDRQSHAVDLSNATVNGVAIPLGPAGSDPYAEFRGDNYAAGYDVGALYQFNDRLRVGVNYHSRVDHVLEGFQTIYIPPQVAEGPLGALVVPQLRTQIYNAHVKQTLPGWVDTSFYWQVTPAWAVMANATWTQWSLFQNSRINPDDPAIPVTTNLQYNFHDTVTAGVGVNYRPPAVQKLLLQGGLTYDQSPIDDSTRQASIPDGSRIELGIGASYRLTRMVALSIAYTHYFFIDANNIHNSIGDTINRTALGTVDLPAGTLIGHYNIDNNALSVGLKTFF